MIYYKQKGEKEERLRETVLVIDEERFIQADYIIFTFFHVHL